MAIVLMTQTYKDYKNSCGRITKTQVADFSLFDNYDLFERTQCSFSFRHTGKMDVSSMFDSCKTVC